MADTSDVQRGSDDRTERDAPDAGFSLIEQVIAMVVIIIVLLGLLGTMGATAKSVVVGRQRTIAVSLAKQVIENLQGADYADVASGSGVTSDPLVSGTKFDLVSTTVFKSVNLNEELTVPGGIASYRTEVTAAGTTFALRTFVTTVPAGYRRVTVIVDWPSISPKRSMRFSSLVFPLVYTSYPASGGSAEVTGGVVTLSGCLGGDTFGDVHVALPGARADTAASTVRTAIGVAASATKHVEVSPRLDPTVCAPVAPTPTPSDVCPRTTAESIADNDSTSMADDLAAPTAQLFDLCPGASTGGITVTAPAGMMTTRAKTDNCAASCNLYGAASDAVPFADATATTTAGSSATFFIDGLTENLWNLGSEWKATAAVDHDTTNAAGGIVKTSATLRAPALGILSLPGVLDGVVKVDAFIATASAASGYTTTDTATAPLAPTVPTVRLWNGTTGYDPVTWVPGPTPFTSPAHTIVVGGRTVTYTLTLRSLPSTATAVVGTPRTDALAQHPSLLVVTVDVQIAPSIAVTATTSTTTTTVVATTVAATTPVAPTPAATDDFTIEVDYGRVLAHATWLAKAV